MTRGAAESRDELLPPSEARRCSCGEPNTTGLCAYRVGQCPRETRDAASVRDVPPCRCLPGHVISACVHHGWNPTLADKEAMRRGA